jgi:hypothetical protein
MIAVAGGAGSLQPASHNLYQPSVEIPSPETLPPTKSLSAAKGGDANEDATGFWQGLAADLGVPSSLRSRSGVRGLLSPREDSEAKWSPRDLSEDERRSAYIILGVVGGVLALGGLADSKPTHKN